MDALHEQDVAFLETECIAQILALTLLEIVGGHGDFLAGKQVGHILVKLLQVKRVERLVVIVAVLVARRAVTVHEVVVEFDDLGHDAVGNQLDRQALGRSGLAAGRRSGNEDHACPTLVVTAGDFVGNLYEMLVVQCLDDIDEQGRIAFSDGAVEFAHVSQADNLVEVDIVGKRLEQFGLGFPFHHLFQILAVWAEQQHPVLVGHQVKHLEHPRRGHERTEEAVDDVVQLIINGVELIGAFQQAHLVLEALFAEHLDDIGGQPLTALEREIGIDDLGHALLELPDDLGRQEFFLVLDLAIMAVADAVLDAEPLAGIEVVERFVQHHAERPRHHAIAGIVGNIKIFNVFGRKDRVLQIFDLVVDHHTHGITLEPEPSLDGVVQLK